MKNLLLPALLWVAFGALVGCPTGDPVPEPGENTPEWPALSEGMLRAGAVDGTLDLPVGIPLAGFTGRDRALGSDPGPDVRDSDYRTDFVPSGGWETRIPAQVLWMDDGTRHAVLVRLDLIYSFDGLTEEIGRRLSEATGEELQDSIFTFTNHSHASYGPFSKAVMLFFGGDFFRQEVFDRMVTQVVELALAARERQVDAQIGLSIDPNFDPIGEDRIFRDRRGENDALLGPEGAVTGPGWKDARASLLRVDAVDGSPIAAVFAFGIHGTVMGGDNALISSEVGGHISTLLQHRHPGPVWMFGQGAGGDASPSGTDEGFARMWSVAETAAPKLLELWENTVVAPGPITFEPAQRYVPMGREMIVTRGGTESLRYAPYDPTWDDEPLEVYEPDLVIYDDEGKLQSPLDEFWPQHGAALCGGADIDISIFGLDIDHPAYKSCLDVKKAYSLFHIGFPSYFAERADYPLPLPESASVMIGALGIRPLQVTTVGEGTAQQDVVFAFAPGEPTTLWTQFLRHRAGLAGADQCVVFGYAMDHVGYLLTADDWLLAGYEPSITVWGPLEGEWILERLAELSGLAATAVGEDPAWPDWPTTKEYPAWDTPFVTPDDTPEAGTVPDSVPPEIFTWDGNDPFFAQPDATIPRIQGTARFTFWGGDPAMGLVTVVIEREDSPGTWEPIRTPSGAPISDTLPDVLVTYTPLPLLGTDGADPPREHLYHATWQAVDTWPGLDARGALPLGRYRFSVSGLRRDPADTAYPFDGIPWSLQSDPFEVVPAWVTLEGGTGDGIVAIRAQYSPAAHGYRHLHPSRNSREGVPLAPAPGGPVVAATEVNGAGIWTGNVDVAGEIDGWSTYSFPHTGLASGDWRVAFDDGYGNTASVVVTIP